jgi:HPt (histidine-containing phosphotransfer) domain-containing protein
LRLDILTAIVDPNPSKQLDLTASTDPIQPVQKTLTPMIDTTELLHRLDGDIDFLQEMTKCLRDEVARFITQLKEALEGNDTKLLLTTAHTIKSMVGNFCAHEIYEVAQNLETSAHEQDTQKLHLLTNRLISLLPQLCDELDLLLRTHDKPHT